MSDFVRRKKQTQSKQTISATTLAQAATLRWSDRTRRLYGIWSYDFLIIAKVVKDIVEPLQCVPKMVRLFAREKDNLLPKLLRVGTTPQ